MRSFLENRLLPEQEYRTGDIIMITGQVVLMPGNALCQRRHFVNMFQLKNGEYPYLADGVTVNAASGYDPQNPNINQGPEILYFYYLPRGWSFHYQ